MLTVSSITKNTGRHAMIHTAFFIFLFQFTTIMSLAICTTQVKKRVKKRLKKKKKVEVTKSLREGDVNPDPPNQLELKKVDASIRWTT